MIVYLEIKEINNKISNKVVELNFNLFNNLETEQVIQELITLENYKKQLLKEYHLK